MIKIENLSYHYPDGSSALDSITLNIRKGEFVAIAGKNGCGKSTLLRHINGLLQPSEGSVIIKGMDTSDNSKLQEIRRTAAMVFQDPQSQFIGMTVEDDIAFGPENLGFSTSEIKKRVSNALGSVGMSAYRYNTPRTLSGGQKQKVALASVLAMEPEIILFDEVTSMLDSGSRMDILSLVRQLHEAGTTIIYVTHLLEELVHADRLMLMENGRMICNGDPREIISKISSGRFGFDAPPIIELSKRLVDAGILEPSFLPLSKDELREAICQLK
ncbi:energy-coupling factor transport system ATP-binding protein [Methanolobus vulcani]|jgi:energy-coupling factor transport system ATP-binding protein|uniref:Energy-coupling factor transport system ATP-binding protein n=1 Tax=Methanolobus vulcani TaxID=38026 RepID=A0A7Z7B084_9EURY|nr:energy-coupling factor transporter ATPase [Methanolobus vulcani]SDF45702.1 energy-coupling factor transport system ATP-binding protein [Methanolobus vulcani]